jgi:hypothetical protein
VKNAVFSGLLVVFAVWKERHHHTSASDFSSHNHRTRCGSRLPVNETRTLPPNTESGGKEIGKIRHALKTTAQLLNSTFDGNAAYSYLAVYFCW